MPSTMRSFSESFARAADGSWRCIAPTALQGPAGRIEVAPGSTFSRGTNVMGVDLAEFLDAEDHVRLETAAALDRINRRSKRARLIIRALST